MFVVCWFFFFNDTSTTEIYTLSLHDALPIPPAMRPRSSRPTHRPATSNGRTTASAWSRRDRKSTRLNSSHTVISYAVFCLKKKKKNKATLNIKKKKKKKKRKKKNKKKK